MHEINPQLVENAQFNCGILFESDQAIAKSVTLIVVEMQTFSLEIICGKKLELFVRTFYNNIVAHHFCCQNNFNNTLGFVRFPEHICKRIFKVFGWTFVRTKCCTYLLTPDRSVLYEFFKLVERFL